LSFLVRVQAAKLFFVANKDASLTEEHVLDGLVEEELFAEIVNLLANETIQLVHDILQDTHTVSPD